MKHHPDHPCGAVPISQWHTTVWYCHEHERWFAACGGFTDTGAEHPMSTTKYSTTEFGPFDTVTDVQHWVQSQLPGVRQLTKLTGDEK